MVDNDVFKKIVFEELVNKVNFIDTSEFVFETQYSNVKSSLENKIPETSGLVKKTDYNPKITVIEGKITALATAAALNAVENKITTLVFKSRKQIMMQKHQTLRLHILPRLITLRQEIFATWNFHGILISRFL